MVRDNQHAEPSIAEATDATAPAPSDLGDTQITEEREKKIHQNQSPTVNAAGSYRNWRLSCVKIWTIVGGCILFIAATYMAGRVWQAVSVVALTAVLSFLLHGVVDSLERRRIPRRIGALAALALIIVCIAGLMILVVPETVTQIGQLATHLPDYAQQAVSMSSTFLDTVTDQSGGTFNAKEELSSALSSIASQMNGVVPHIIDGVMMGATSVSGAVLVGALSLLCSYWVLIDLPKISSELIALVPEHRQDDANLITGVVGDAVYGWVKATIICMVITGVATTVAYAVTGVPYAMLLGVATGFLYLIPYVGPAISCIAAVIVALLVSPACALAVLIENIVINNVVANIISPKLMSSSMSVHPAVIIVAMLAGGAIGGMWGMLLAVPIAGAVQGIAVALYEKRTGKVISTSDGVLFQSRGVNGPYGIDNSTNKNNDSVGE